MFTYADYMRSETKELYFGPFYYAGLALGLTARFVFGMMIICLIWKNKETQFTQNFEVDKADEEEKILEQNHDVNQQAQFGSVFVSQKTVVFDNSGIKITRSSDASFNYKGQQDVKDKKAQLRSSQGHPLTDNQSEMQNH